MALSDAVVLERSRAPLGHALGVGKKLLAREVEHADFVQYSPLASV